MRSPSEGSSEQEERHGSVARPSKENIFTSQVKQLPTLQRAGVDIVSSIEKRPLLCSCLMSMDRHRGYFSGTNEI